MLARSVTARRGICRTRAPARDLPTVRPIQRPTFRRDRWNGLGRAPCQPCSRLFAGRCACRRLARSTHDSAVLAIGITSAFALNRGVQRDRNGRPFRVPPRPKIFTRTVTARRPSRPKTVCANVNLRQDSAVRQQFQAPTQEPHETRDRSRFGCHMVARPDQPRGNHPR